MTFRSGRAGRLAHAMIFLAFVARAAFADSTRVERARRAYDELRFEDVLAEVSAARRAGGLSRAENAELTRLEAFTYAVFDDESRALDAFERLLRLEPGYELPADTSPKIKGYFARARERLKPAPKPKVTVQHTRKKDPPFYASGWFWGTFVVTVGLGLGVGIALEK